MSTHPFTPTVGDEGPTMFCDRCGQHQRTHQPGWRPPATAVAGPTGEAVYTMAELADLAGVTVGTIRAHRSRGGLPPEDGRLGNVPYWYPDTVMVWLSERRPRGNPAWHKGMPSPGPRGPDSRSRQ